MRTRYSAKAGRPTEIAQGLVMQLPGTGVTDIEIDGEPFTVEMKLNLTDEGVRPTSITVTANDGGAINGTTLRSIRVWDLAREMIRTGVASGNARASGARNHITDDEVERIRTGGPTDEAMRWVAHFYNLGRVLGLPPAKHVEDNLGLPRTTASKWVRRARERGLLDEDRNG